MSNCRRSSDITRLIWEWNALKRSRKMIMRSIKTTSGNPWALSVLVVQRICYNSGSYSSQLSFNKTLLRGLNLWKAKENRSRDSSLFIKTGATVCFVSSPSCSFWKKKRYNLKLNCRQRNSKPFNKRSFRPCFFLCCTSYFSVFW